MARHALVSVVIAACASAPDTPSELCKTLNPGDLVITEFLSDPTGTDTGSEWIEVYNPTAGDTPLKGVTVYVKRLDGTGLKLHVIRAGTVAAQGYFTLGDVRGTAALPPYIGYSYADALGALSNTDGVLGLLCGETVVDEVQYTVTSTPGHARQLDGTLTPDATANDDEARWCDADQPIAGSLNYGTPGAANTPCQPVVGPPSCIDATTGLARPIVMPLPGQVFFTEVMPNPQAVPDAVGEWIELHSVADVDLNGAALTVGAQQHTFSSHDCLFVSSGGYALLAKASDAAVNGGLPPVLATFPQSLTNSGAILELSANDAVVDTAVFGSAISGVAWQLDPRQLDATGNDNPTHFCRATLAYGAGDFGTPAAVNTACQMTVNLDQCIDPASSQPRGIVRPSVGDLVITEFLADPAAVADSVGEFIEVRANAAVDLNGIVLGFDSGRSGINSPTCLAVSAGSYSVFAASADSQVNGGLPPVAGTFTFGLANSGLHTLSLLNNDGGVLDTLLYGPDAGRVATGASTQLSSRFTSPSDNDTAANLCVTSTASRYGPLRDAGVGDRGTPGLPNEACP
jgi:hypothetical protein